MDFVLVPATLKVTCFLSLLYSTSLRWTEMVPLSRHVLNPDVLRIWSASPPAGRVPNSNKETVDNVENGRNIVTIAKGQKSNRSSTLPGHKYSYWIAPPLYVDNESILATACCFVSSLVPTEWYTPRDTRNDAVNEEIRGSTWYRIEKSEDKSRIVWLYSENENVAREEE